MTIWFTSDTHFDHKNIIGYCDRPFRDLDAMNRALIVNWNAVVNPDDLVYHLGDFAFASAGRVAEIAGQLNGRKVLVKGNHDSCSMAAYIRAGFEDVVDNADLLTFGYPVYLAHHPIPYNLPEGFTHQLCGHVHEVWKRHSDRYSTVVNVGVDQWGYMPVSLSRVLIDLELDE